MDTYSQTLFAARNAEHDIRLRASLRLQDADLAVGITPIRPRAFPFRAWLSAALISAGERLHDVDETPSRTVATP
jgi:hypothetical protein